MYVQEACARKSTRTYGALCTRVQVRVQCVYVDLRRNDDCNYKMTALCRIDATVVCTLHPFNTTLDTLCRCPDLVVLGQ